jgi:signal transduction histidine kinase
MRRLPALVARLSGAGLALAVGVGAVVLADGPAHSITYAGRSRGAAALTVAVAVALVVAALATLAARRATRTVELLVLASIAWCAPVWVGWTGGPPAVRSIAAMLPGLTLPLVLHTTLAYPGGRLGAAWPRALIALAYGEALVTAGLLALFRDPYFDPSCWANCSVNTFLVASHPSLVHVVELTDRWCAAGLATAFCVACAVWLARASLPARVRLAPVQLPAVAFAAAVVARAVRLQQVDVEDPFDATLAAIFQVTSWALILLAAGLVWSVARAHAERRAVTRIAADLDVAPVPGSVRAALAAALRDPGLQIAYWMPQERRFVDADGHPVAEPTGGADRLVTRLTRHGHTVAVIEHAATAETLTEQIGPSLRLGLENERLQAQVLADLAELRASRARIVETADAERRHLERDLHDGAQQHLLALSYDVRVAHAAAKDDADATTAVLLDEAIGQTQSAIGDLRALAHGIYPAILTEAGLGPALESLAYVAPLPLELHLVEQRRYATAVETAAYLAVCEAVDSAARRGAEHALVRVTRADGALIVTVQDDALHDGRWPVSIADRVGALGGSVEVTARQCRAVIPCG